MHTSILHKAKRRSFLSFIVFFLAGWVPAGAQDNSVIPGETPGQDVMALAAGGLDHALSALPGIVGDTLQRSGVPGAAVAVVHKDKTLFSAGFGLRQIGKPDGIDPATVFQIASLSKPITASVTAVAVTRGQVAWDDPVVRHLQGFRLINDYVSRHVTIGDLMAHRSGLPMAAGDELEDLGYDRRQIMQRLAQVPLDRFRISYHYANFGTTIAAEAVAAAAGKNWEELAEQSLFKPLGMGSTSSRHADFLTRPNRAVLHALEDGRFQPLFDRNPDAQSPAGGVSSNVLDLAEWLKFLLAKGQHKGEQLASEQALLAAMSPQAFSAQPHTITARPGFYGYGFNIGVNANGRTSYSHSGAFLLGAGTAFTILPSADIGIVVLTNGSPMGAAESISANFMDIVQYGRPLRDWYAGYHSLMKGYFNPEGDLAGKARPAAARPAKALQTYAGSYQNAYFGSADITIDNERLVLTLGPKSERFELEDWDGDAFALSPRSENAPQGSRSSVLFSVKDDKVESFTIDYLNKNGLGTWKR